MTAKDMDNRGVTDLLCAMTALAYDDYVNGGILLNESVYEINSGVIRLISVRGKRFGAYTSHQRTALNAKVRFYSSAKSFLEGTRMGDYLLEQAKKDIEKGNYRGNRKTVAFNKYEGVNV